MPYVAAGQGPKKEQSTTQLSCQDHQMHSAETEMHSAETEMHSAEAIFNENPRRSLNKERFATAVGKVMNQPLDKMVQLFDRIDRNVGGEVSWEEFISEMDKPPADMQGSINRPPADMQGSEAREVAGGNTCCLGSNELMAATLASMDCSDRGAETGVQDGCSVRTGELAQYSDSHCAGSLRPAAADGSCAEPAQCLEAEAAVCLEAGSHGNSRAADGCHRCCHDSFAHCCRGAQDSTAHLGRARSGECDDGAKTLNGIQSMQPIQQDDAGCMAVDLDGSGRPAAETDALIQSCTAVVDSASLRSSADHSAVPTTADHSAVTTDTVISIEASERSVTAASLISLAVDDTGEPEVGPLNGARTLQSMHHRSVAQIARDNSAEISPICSPVDVYEQTTEPAGGIMHGLGRKDVFHFNKEDVCAIRIEAEHESRALRKRVAELEAELAQVPTDDVIDAETGKKIGKRKKTQPDGPVAGPSLLSKAAEQQLRLVAVKKEKVEEAEEAVCASMHACMH